ncbi:hypothetical protein SAMN05518871_10432 [Psychrobacillus sp. OK028]|uniref:hypothetical protein n=1 Tax=Psychrobacillus sp. OK028 TaxID=1884359 RepID=UPI000891424C|nr:hypothetical protein [Psychrobacillus sp. OK028]SDN22960.1 hypothetical protein SAMN05518871_10432 [Psychrobacillus sp. OK028]
MWKKVVPAVALSSLLLVGCNNRDNAIPNNNETPMEDVRNDINTPSPNRNNGMDNGRGNGTLNDGTINDGTINDGTMNNGINDNGTINNGNGNVPNDGVNNNNDHLIKDKNNIK